MAVEESGNPMSSMPKPNALRWLWLTALVIALDQLTKSWVLADIRPGEQIPVISGFWYWTLAFNKGAAFSFLSDAGGWQRWFFVTIGVLVSAAMVVWLSRLDVRERLTAYGLALVVGGAIGNLIDRILLGKVVDFLQWHWQDWYWPSFNLADSAITLGVVLLLLDGLFPGRSNEEQKS